MYIKDVDHLGNWQCQVSLQISLEITVIPLHFCFCYSILIILPLVYTPRFLKVHFTCALYLESPVVFLLSYLYM